MLSIGKPTVENGFVLPLIWAAAQHQAVLHPDAYPGNMKAGLLESPAKVQPFGIRMEDVRAAALGHVCCHVLESGQQEGEELLVRHAVVLDLLSVSGLIRHVVGRIGHDQVCLDAVHERVHRFGRGTVSTHHAVPAQRPDVAGLHIGLHFLRVDIAVVVMHILVMHL